MTVIVTGSEGERWVHLNVQRIDEEDREIVLTLDGFDQTHYNRRRVLRLEVFP
jgi:hypothetical protein